ncbi:hypothetical protein MK079_04065 [Candidatus Gracilibacteria bacterium]|nr:hypothetical protein [Candidatus Gracilibacteria bacterium]
MPGLVIVSFLKRYNTGSIFLTNLSVTEGLQEIAIDWNKVLENVDDSVEYSIDINNDGSTDGVDV